MDIAKAKALKVGDYVQCPTDRGDAAYGGRVSHVSQETYTNLHGTPYIWITVQRGPQSAVWPSNRLG